MDKIPFVSIGQGELDGNKKLKKGDLIHCPHCSGKHSVKFGRDTDNIETDAMMFYDCGKTTYMCGVDGIALSGIRLKEEK